MSEEGEEEQIIGEGGFASEKLASEVTGYPKYEFTDRKNFWKEVLPFFDKPITRANLSDDNIRTIWKGVRAFTTTYVLSHPNEGVTLEDMIKARIQVIASTSQARNGKTLDLIFGKRESPKKRRWG